MYASPATSGSRVEGTLDQVITTGYYYNFPHPTERTVFTFPISEAQEMEIWFGTADDNLTRDVIFKGRPGRFCSIPFFGGGAYPYGKKAQGKCYQLALLYSETC